MVEKIDQNQTEQPQQEAGGEAVLNQYMLKDIYERSQKDYGGKYPSALFEKNFDLSAAEITEVKKLIDSTKGRLDGLVKQEPLWKDFSKALKERRDKSGILMEEDYIIEDESINEIKKDKIQVTETSGKKKDVPVLKVPTRIKRLYQWGMFQMHVNEDLANYQSGVARNQSAVRFGRGVRGLYRFNKEIFTQTGK